MCIKTQHNILLTKKTHRMMILIQQKFMLNNKSPPPQEFEETLAFKDKSGLEMLKLSR